MDDHGSGDTDRDRARAYGLVADAYDRARPSYPREAATWLVGGTTGRVLELGAGTGKLTEVLVDLGHAVTATDPSEPMLRLLARRAPGATALLSAAESIPFASRSVDVVVSAHAFHWFDHTRALPEIARVLRPSGMLGLVWNQPDRRIPWVRRLGDMLERPELVQDPTDVLIGSRLFGFVETSTYRFWQPMTNECLRDLVASRSRTALMSELERERLLHQVDGLYDSYGRGYDGMLMPYVTRCFRAAVRPRAPGHDGSAPAAGPDDPDTDALLIDFR